MSSTTTSLSNIAKLISRSLCLSSSSSRVFRLNLRTTKITRIRRRRAKPPLDAAIMVTRPGRVLVKTEAKNKRCCRMKTFFNEISRYLGFHLKNPERFDRPPSHNRNLPQLDITRNNHPRQDDCRENVKEQNKYN